MYWYNHGKIRRNHARTSDKSKIKSYFHAGTVSNLSQTFFTETVIKVLKRGLGFVPTPNLMNEADLPKYFEEFNRKMRICKWYFRNEPSDNCSNAPAFRPKSKCKPDAGHLCVGVFLGSLEN